MQDDSSSKAFREPSLALNRIYTKQGDDGSTRLVGGQQLPKDALRIECYGTVDELNACIGLAAAEANRDERTQKIRDVLVRVQHELFNLGSVLATMPEDVGPKQPRVTDADVRQLEAEMDAVNAELPALRSFVLPGGNALNAQLHLCRTVCRRAERLCVTLQREAPGFPEMVRYLNRLSDALFVWSRWASLRLDSPEVLWEPNRAASGQGS